MIPRTHFHCITTCHGLHALVEWIGGVDWRSGRAPDSGSTGCEFESHHCFNSLTALGKLITTNVHPLDPGDEWVPGLGQYLPAPEKIVVAAWGVCSPGS